MLNAGDLTERIVIQYKAAASPDKNSIGEDDYAWAQFLSTRAKFRFVKGQGEKATAAQVEARFDVTFEIRYRDGVTAGMRVLHDDKYYDIQNVENVRSMNRDLTIYCTQGVSLG